MKPHFCELQKSTDAYARTESRSRRDLLKSSLALPVLGISRRNANAEPAAWGDTADSAPKGLMAESGWCWEGQGYTGAGWSIFGVGEGARYFGLDKAFHLWRRNDDLVMEKLRPMKEVVCEITATRPLRCGPYCVQAHYDSSPDALLREAANVAQLSQRYANLTGAYIDDTLGRPGRKPNAITPELWRKVYGTLKKGNPRLKLWALVFANQLMEEDWADFKSMMDVIHLWVWDSKDLPRLDGYIERCHKLFPGKPVNVGCFLWDYPSMKYSRGNYEKGHAVPMELLEFQWRRVRDYLASGAIAGYAILGAYLIDYVREQVVWVRDFIAAN